jgi:hypothetical protein
MTSPSPHLDLDALADLLAEEASASDIDHLAACASCTDRLAELRDAQAAVLAELRTLGAPPLPAEVAERLDVALAEQEPLAPARAASVTALPERRPARASRGAGWLPAAAAAVLVLGGAGFAASQLGGGPGAGDTSTAAGGSAELAAPAVSDLRLTASGADWADPDAAVTSLARVLNGDATTYRLSGEGEAGEERTARGSDDSADAETQEQEQERESLAAATAAPLPPTEDELSTLRTPEGLDACLSSLLTEQDPGARPLAVDYATFDGAPALAVVLPDPDPSQASIFVVGSDCTAVDPDLLQFRRAALP